MSARARAVITINGVDLTFPYSQVLITQLKLDVPAFCRSYAPATKTWTVREPYVDLAVSMVRRAYPDLRVDDRRQYHTGLSVPAARSAPEYAALHLLPTAPPELVEAAYKTLARIHHPDRGGSTETMTQINEAVSAIRKQAS